ncbi:MAG: aminotransferase class I/II-fold pyridoxal phosphate-dependent enzyme, partial [Actinomycetota bacterium]|nr:aminotransferase class I/II-fold pyridoxal phosphate-dependent enzyme [Actinomycetota bacterium]
MVRGWAQHPGGRHHGAHGDLVSRSLGVRVGELLDFSQNINPLGAPKDALEAARRALYEDSGRYPDLEYIGLREALAAYLGVGAEMVVPTNGGAEALFLAARAAGTGGKALVLEPTFSEYAAAAAASGKEPVRRVARREEDFEWDSTPLRDLEGVSVVFLCNPNNPTGDLLDRGAVLEVAARVVEAGAVLVVDEAFADFVPEISVTDMVDRGLWVARSFTKFFAIPGLRLGCLVCDDAGRVQTLQPSWPVNSVAAAAGIAAVEDKGFAEASRAEVARLREDLFGALAALPGLQPFPGAANFLLVRGPDGLPERLARRGVLVRGCG